MTRREACELKLVKDGMKLEGGQIKAMYPFIKQGNLSNNQGQVMSMQSSLEKRLMKTDKIEVYNSCFQDFINRGVLKEVTEEELEAWEGGINYVSHHHVSKDSTSTPLRIIVNSSLKNNSEASYNSLIAKGPNTLSKLYTVLVRFRAYEVIIV